MSASMWDDEPGEVHADHCTIHNTNTPCSCGAELERLQAVESAAIALLAKVAEHELRGYERIRLGVFGPLRAALHGSVTTAVRLDALVPVELDCDEDGAA